MAYMQITGIDSYKKLDDWMGNRETKEVAYKTVARRGGYHTVNHPIDDHIIIKMWNTDIYTIFPNNVATLDVGKWFTVTTKQRIVDLLPQGLTIDSVKGRWYLVRIEKGTEEGGPQHWRKTLSVFYNGIQINVATMEILHSDQVLEEAGKAMLQDAKNIVMRRKIAAYIKGLSDETIKELAQEHSLAGDCLLCRMGQQGYTNDVDHLETHLDEKYYFTSLIWNACTEAKRGNPYYCMMIPTIVRHDLGRYLRKRLLKGVAVA